jgi:hypothetical protein
LVSGDLPKNLTRWRDKKREALGIMGERERVLMDMADRQALEVEAGEID